MCRFNARFYNEENRTTFITSLHKLRIENFLDKKDKDDSSALKKLVTKIDKLCGMCHATALKCTRGRLVIPFPGSWEARANLDGMYWLTTSNQTRNAASHGALDGQSEIQERLQGGCMSPAGIALQGLCPVSYTHLTLPTRPLV